MAHGYSRGDLRQHLAARAEQLQARTGDWGKDGNPAWFIDGTCVNEPKPVQRSAYSPVLEEMDRTLAQAAETRRDPFMLRMCREWHIRQIARQAAAVPASARVASGTGWPELSR